MSTQRGYGPHGAPVHHGYLVKRAVGKRRAIGKQVPSWRQRYLILSDSELAWHEQAEVSESGDVTIKSRLLGALPVTKECVLTENADSANGKRDYTFSVKSGAHVLVLQAASEEERQEWVANIRRVIQTEGLVPKSTRSLTVTEAASADPDLSEEADPADEAAWQDMNAPPLSSYRSYAAAGSRTRHLEPWIYLILLKVMEGEDIHVHEIRSHFEHSDNVATSVYFQPPSLEEQRLIGSYELTAVDVAGLGSVSSPVVSGRIVYTREGLMAASVILHAEGRSFPVGYSGEWRTMGSDVSSHVLHWAHCNIHVGQTDTVTDAAARPHNYYSTRTRALHMSTDSQELTLTTGALSLRWRRAPVRGWAFAETSPPSAGDLHRHIMGSTLTLSSTSSPTDEAQLLARRVYKANLVLQALVTGFMEPTEQELKLRKPPYDIIDQ